MRKLTATEKLRAVNEGNMTKKEFVRQMRQTFPQNITQFNGFNDSVQILKNKGLLFESAALPKDDSNVSYGFSDEAIRRGTRIEMKVMGIDTYEFDTPDESVVKAKALAIKNLRKDPLHYLNLLSGESSKVDKNDQSKEVKRGAADVDSFNGLKKAALKEGYTEAQIEAAIQTIKEKKLFEVDKGDYNRDSLIKALGDADDAFIHLSDGRELIIYNPNSNNDDNASMWHNDTVFAVDQDGQEEEVDYRDITSINLEQKLSEAEPIPTEPGQTKIGDDGVEYGVRATNHERKMAMRRVIDALTITGDEKGHRVNLDDALSFIRTHKEDIFSGDIDTADVQDIWMNYNEFEDVNRDSIEEEGMSDEEMDNIKNYGKGDEIKKYRLGDHFSSNFDYEGMMKAGLKVRINTPLDKLEKLFSSFEDVNYHREGEGLSYMIDSIEAGNKEEALESLKKFRAALKQSLSDLFEGVFPVREAEEGYVRRSERLQEGRRKKTKGGKIVTENDYETGGYVESMGPDFDKAVDKLIAAFGDWKEGPMTEPGMIPHAKSDVVSYIDQKLEESLAEAAGPDPESICPECDGSGCDHCDGTGAHKIREEELDEKKGKDHDGDGDVDKDDYMAAKDKAIKKASGKNEAMIKSNLKAIIAKVLEEQVLNEAATAELSNWGETYDDFSGVKAVVHDLENIVTEVESFYDKIGEKIAKTFAKTADFTNGEGLKIGAFIAPSLEAAFKKDLRPVTKRGFLNKTELPKVRTVSKAEIDAHNSGQKPLGETEIEEQPKQTVYTPNI